MTDEEVIHALLPVESLALTIYGESRGEPIEGQVAVGNVIMNRFKSGGYKTIKDVCFKRHQFSCWNIGDPNRDKLMSMARKLVASIGINDKHYRQCLAVANSIIAGDFLDNTRGCDHYMTTSLFNSSKRPGWAKNPSFAKVIGSHTFLKL